MITSNMKHDQADSQSRRTAATQHSRLPTPTLLCVDDDPGIVAAIELRLRQYDLKVLALYTGMQGYWQAVTRRPDLIITDLRMPYGDGDYLLKCLQRNPRTAGIPVLVLTGQRADDLPTRIEHLGAEAILQKPIHGEELVEHIARFIPLREREEGTRTPMRRP